MFDLGNIFSDEGDPSGTIFRDVIMLALAGFIVIVLLLLPHINPPNKNASEETTPPGNIIVEIQWPDEIDVDIDLWVQAPGDVPVGYSNKGGVVFNLLRDDLGHFMDLLTINYENAYTRGIIPGEYTINLHVYRNSSGIYPVPVTIKVSKKADKNANFVTILTTKVRMEHENQELTVFRFDLNDIGDIKEGSLNTIFKPLRARQNQ